MTGFLWPSILMYVFQASSPPPDGGISLLVFKGRNKSPFPPQTGPGPLDKLHVTGPSGSSPWSLLPRGSFLMKLMRWAYFEVSQHKDPSTDLDPLVWAECPYHSAASPSSLAGMEEPRELSNEGAECNPAASLSLSTVHPREPR